MQLPRNDVRIRYDSNIRSMISSRFGVSCHWLQCISWWILNFSRVHSKIDIQLNPDPLQLCCNPVPSFLEQGTKCSKTDIKVFYIIQYIYIYIYIYIYNYIYRILLYDKFRTFRTSIIYDKFRTFSTLFQERWHRIATELQRISAEIDDNTIDN